MTEMLPRSSWTATPRPVDRLSANDPGQLRGFAVHWPGTTAGTYANPTLDQSAARLEAERQLHVNDHGWTDIAYLAAVDLAGRLFDCRGADYECAANGNQTVNHQYGALTVLACPGDVITPEAINAVRWWRVHEWLTRYPHATAVVGHRDLYQTDCPGDSLYHIVQAGAFTQPPEDDMPLTQSDLLAVAAATRDAILSATYGKKPDGTDHHLSDVWGETLTGVNALRDGATKGATLTLAPGDADAIGRAVAAHLPPGAGLTQADVRAALAAVLATVHA